MIQLQNFPGMFPWAGANTPNLPAHTHGSAAEPARFSASRRGFAPMDFRLSGNTVFLRKTLRSGVRISHGSAGVSYDSSELCQGSRVSAHGLGCNRMRENRSIPCTMTVSQERTEALHEIHLPLDYIWLGSERPAGGGLPGTSRPDIYELQTGLNGQVPDSTRWLQSAHRCLSQRCGGSLKNFP